MVWIMLYSTGVHICFQLIVCPPFQSHPFISHAKHESWNPTQRNRYCVLDSTSSSFIGFQTTIFSEYFTSVLQLERTVEFQWRLTAGHNFHVFSWDATKPTSVQSTSSYIQVFVTFSRSTGPGGAVGGFHWWSGREVRMTHMSAWFLFKFSYRGKSNIFSYFIWNLKSCDTARSQFQRIVF